MRFEGHHTDMGDLCRRYRCPVFTSKVNTIEGDVKVIIPIDDSQERIDNQQVEVNLLEGDTTVSIPETEEIIFAKNFYKVQVGFFDNRRDALALAEKLDKEDFIYYLKWVDNGWRVQVGAFIKEEGAMELQGVLKEKGFESILVYE